MATEVSIMRSTSVPLRLVDQVKAKHVATCFVCNASRLEPGALGADTRFCPMAEYLIADALARWDTLAQEWGMW